MISQIYDLLGQFITENLGVPVIELNQNAPFANKPFITVGINSTRITSTPCRYGISDDGIQKTILNKEIVVSFEAFSDNLHQSDEILQQLEHSLLCDPSFTILTDKLVYINSINGVQSVSSILNDWTESRALLECIFRYQQEINVNTGIIEEVEVENINL